MERVRYDEEALIAEALAGLHARFEQVHPFLDGNGRAGRLILNLLLVRLGIPPAAIYKGGRSRYLAALRRVKRATGSMNAHESARRTREGGFGVQVDDYELIVRARR